MRLRKNVQSGHSGIRLAICCMLTAVALVSAGSETAVATGDPKTVAEIALYQGPDREQILIEGAEKEGQLTFYNTNTWINDAVVKAFEKEYPFIKVSSWRGETKEMVKRVTMEYAAKRFLVDVIELDTTGTKILRREGIFQEYYSPEASYYGDEVKGKGKTGVYYLGDREIYIGLGFNTKLIPPAEAPKTLKDLLNPRWKGKISIAASSTGIRWIGNALETMGRDYIERLSRQAVKVQNISSAALANLIVSGEVPLSPTIFYSNIVTVKAKGAPVEWRPLEPVIASIGYLGMATKVAHPHAALLFLNYVHSKEGQKVVMKGGLGSPREDMGSSGQKYKKSRLEDKYPIEEYEKKFSEWENLLKRLFIGK